MSVQSIVFMWTLKVKKTAQAAKRVNAFDVVSGTKFKPKANAPTYTRVFGESLN